MENFLAIAQAVFLYSASAIFVALIFLLISAAAMIWKILSIMRQVPGIIRREMEATRQMVEDKLRFLDFFKIFFK